MSTTARYILLATLWTVGCSGASVRSNAGGTRGALAGETPSVAKASQLLRAGSIDRAEAVIAALPRQARKGHAALAISAIIQWRRGARAEAQTLVRQLAAQAIELGGQRARRDFERVSKVILDGDDGFVWLWQSLAPAREYKPLRPRARTLHEIIVGAAKHKDTQQLLACLDLLKAWEQPSTLTRITTLMMSHHRWRALSVVARHLRERGSLTGWTLALRSARHQRGPQHREQWLSSLYSARLTTSQLRTLSANHEIWRDQAVLARVQQLIIKRADATDADRVALIQNLRSQIRRSVTPWADQALRGLATKFDGGAAAKRALVDALLEARETDLAAKLLGPETANTTSEELVLHAELARLCGDLNQMRALAAKAYERSGRSIELCAKMAKRWRRSAPNFANQWRRRLPNSTAAAQGSLKSRAMAALGRWSPTARQLNEVREYARELAKLTGTSPQVTAFVQQLWSRYHRPQWRVTLRAALVTLATARDVSESVLVKWATAAVRMGDIDDAMRAWRRLQRSSMGVQPGHKSQLIAAALATRRAANLAEVVTRGDIHPHHAGPLALSAANLLLRGHHKLLGRQWAEAALTSDPLALWPRLSGRPQLGRANRGNTRRITQSRLKGLVDNGAADVVLRYLDGPGGWAGRGSSRRVNHAVLRVEAMMKLGQHKRARRTLKTLRASVGSRGISDWQLMGVAKKLGLCEVVIDAAERLVRLPTNRSVRRAIDASLECAQRAGRVSLAYRVVRSLMKHQLRLSLHLHAAQQLVRYGFPKLAVHVFEQSHRGRRPSRTRPHIYSWSQALLDLGRTSDAVLLLREMTRAYGRRAPAWRRAIELLTRYGHANEALSMNHAALKLHPNDAALQFTALRLELASPVSYPLHERVKALALAGASEAQWRDVLSEAERSGGVGRLHQALLQVNDNARSFQRFRLWVAARAGDRATVTAGVRNLRARGPVERVDTVKALAQIGLFRGARDAAEDLVAKQGLGRRRATVRERLELAMTLSSQPADRQSALALTRLAVGRALDPHKTAQEAATALERQGHVATAYAIGQFAQDGSVGNPMRLCAQGRRAMLSGQRQRALQLWRRAVALISLDLDTRRSGRSNRAARRCLIQAAQDAGEYDAQRRWLSQWLQLQPMSTELWRDAIKLEHLTGHDERGLKLLLKASKTLRQWPKDKFNTVTLGLLSSGQGRALLDHVLAAPETLRTEPWWIQTLFTLSLRHEHASGPAMRRMLNTLADADAHARASLSLAWLQQGRVNDAIQRLGDAPLSQPSMSGRDTAERKLLFRAVASALIGLQYGAERSRKLTPTSPPTGAVNALLTKWMPPNDWTTRARLAEELTIQGAAGLASAVLLSPPHKAGVLSPGSARLQALRVLSAIATDKVLLKQASAWFQPDSGRPYRRSSDSFRVKMVRALLSWGRAHVAVALARRLSPVTQLKLPTWLTRPGGPLSADAQGATQQPNPYAKLSETKVSLSAPEQISRATAARAERLDEPWRAWTDTARAAALHRRRGLLKRALERAEKLDAPPAQTACLKLISGLSQDHQACLQRRHPSTLHALDLQALAAAAGRSPNAPWTEPFARQIARAGPMALARWIAALAAARDFTEPKGAAQVARAALEMVPKGSARKKLLHFALDDLADLQVMEAALADSRAQYERHPEGRGHRNNLAYARLLAGESARDALLLATPALARRAGQSVEALMDTLATGYWALNQRQRALTHQRLSLTASRSNAAFAQLPLMRYAEMLAKTGSIRAARLTASHALALSVEVLDRAQASSIDEIGDLLPMLQAHHLLVKRRALIVLRACAKAQKTLHPRR